MRFNVELTADDLRQLVLKKLQETCGVNLSPEDVEIEVRSKQNWKAEWERADFRARVEMPEEWC